MIKDALRCSKQLSLYMQSNDASVINVKFHIENVCEKLLAIKEINGQSLKKFIDSCSTDSCFRGIHITKGDADEETFASLRRRFFQTLHDNILQRFPPTSFLRAASALNKLSWPNDPLQKVLFGETETALLCKEFNIPTIDAADIVMEFSIYKKQQRVGSKLAKFLLLQKVLPISSADCERGFSQMNLHHTSLRNSLGVQTVSNLMMISINGPSVKNFNARKHVISWLKSGRHGALRQSYWNTIKRSTNS